MNTIELQDYQHSLILDLANYEPFDYFHNKIMIPRNESLTLNIQLKDSIPYNLTDLNVGVGFIKPDRTILKVFEGEYLSIVDAAQGQIKLTLTPDLVGLVGRTLLEIQVFQGIQRMTFKPILYYTNRINEDIYEVSI